jgi:hypothetical protein
MPQERKIELVQVKANGKAIPIKGFVQDIIGLSILGMLSSLKGVDNPKSIQIEIKIKQ